MSVSDDITDLTKKLKVLGVPENKINKEELRGLIFNAQRRFNRYEMYQPGDTFERRLIKWLTNFSIDDRCTAVDLVKNIRYISRNELRAISEFVLDLAATRTWKFVIKFYKPGKTSCLDDFKHEMRRNIFIAVSDDIGLDYFRRYGRRRFPFLEKENFIEYYKMGKEDIIDICKTIDNPKRFFLLDQISASGTTALRIKDKGGHKPESKGKLRTFFDRWREQISGKEVYYVPLIASSFVESILREHLDGLAGDVTGIAGTKISPILLVPTSEWLMHKSNGDYEIDNSIVKLLEKYYSRFTEDKHTLEGGGSLFGVGSVGLSLVVGTNCPNNSLFIIWHAFNNWYPLFPRVAHHRHTPSLFTDVETQEEKLIKNCKRPISSTALQQSSIIEINDVLSSFDFTASIKPMSQDYHDLTKLLQAELTVIESGSIYGAVSKVREKGFKEKKNIEIRLAPNKQVLTQETSDTFSPQYELIVPFLSAVGPIHNLPAANLINEIVIIPALMFPLSGNPSIESILAMHADYIDSYKIRTEKMLYLPAESPAVSFRRTIFLLESYKNSGIEYEKMCLLPAYDATSTLVAIAIAGLLEAKIQTPEPPISQPIIEENNLILAKQ